MHIHILGICGTFMGSLAIIAKQMGHEVTGSDAGIYPPMSDQLEAHGIPCFAGYLAEHLDPAPDCVIIGNALPRGNAVVEHILNHDIPYMSGPQWLAENVLRGRWVLAVAGTHGKTTTTSLLAWILEYADLDPGFLIGGVPENFGVSGRYRDSRFFVVEADEYDTAFFDKRAKFIHYHPRTLILNNLEYDHADIYSNLAAIQKQFHHLIRTVPGNGLIVHNDQTQALTETLEMGCWTARESFNGNHGLWRAVSLQADGSVFEVWRGDKWEGVVRWNLLGAHNQQNALAAIAAACHAGVTPSLACEAAAQFRNVKRRLEMRGQVRGVTVYDDFAHHPTAIALTIQALRGKVGSQRVIAVLEPRSNTMRLGVHRETLPAALAGADQIILLQPPKLGWQLRADAANTRVFDRVENILRHLVEIARPDDHILIMSNGGFEHIHQRLLDALSKTA
jgi:UDP-N-acetylmuramate: L-alanyl-gamma-D-glutamyl-meso-diaminopimelate ligase